MDLNLIGKHCALQSCNALDFLPIQCSCLQWFCKLHITPDFHDCPSGSESVQQHPSESSATSVRSKCVVPGCNKLSLATGATAGDLTREGGSFCIDHRHMQSHSRTGFAIGKDDTKHEAARVILAQKFLATGIPASHTPVVTGRLKNPSSDPKVLAQLQKINIIKLRHRAVPADPKDKSCMVPVDQRIHVIVCLEILGQSRKEVVLWFRKTTVTGKALDLIAQHFGVSNTVTTSTLHLEQSSTEIGSHVLENHLELSGQLEDGSTVLLTDSCSNR